MIASLQGILESFSEDWAIINVGGIGFKVFLPTSTLSSLGAIGGRVKLYTHLHVREDNIALYGFSTDEELRLFEILMTVSGVGPKLGLAMLSAMDAGKLATALATGNVDLLMMVPGIGKKTSHRLILELKDKISAAWVTAPAMGMAEESTEVVAALTSLGYSAAEAARAVASLPPLTKLSLEEKIKLALQYFGGK